MSEIAALYGPLFVGLLFATFLHGILSMQVYMYYSAFPSDLRRNKILVAALWCIDFLNLALIAQSQYNNLITNFGNISLATTWEIDLQLVLIGIDVFVCQVFFLRRLWILSGKRTWQIAALAAMCLLNLAIYVLMSVEMVIHPLISEWAKDGVTVHFIEIFAIGTATDIIIAALMVRYLWRGRTAYATTNALLSTVIHYTVATGLATSLLSFVCLIAYITSNSSVFFAMQYSLGRMYTNALLATLNARRSLRDAADARVLHGTVVTSLHFAAPVPQSQVGAIELDRVASLPDPKNP